MLPLFFPLFCLPLILIKFVDERGLCSAQYHEKTNLRDFEVYSPPLMRRAVVTRFAVLEKTKTTVRRAFFERGDDCFLRPIPLLEGVVDAKNDDALFSRAGLRVSSPCSNVVAWSFNVYRRVIVEEEVAELPGYAPPGVDVVLMAVPKAKVTPSRKKRRNQFKKVEFVRDARKCPTCRKPMRSWHNFCCPPKDEKEDVVYSTTE